MRDASTACFDEGSPVVLDGMTEPCKYPSLSKKSAATTPRTITARPAMSMALQRQGGVVKGSAWGYLLVHSTIPLIKINISLREKERERERENERKRSEE